ncbi:MAG: hypothetical protein P2A85_10495 [Microcoleus anatoxicus]|uniref:hypothetical protein n=1 Tax=Microcoleus anatoxicus TaxID=2705319 RepID=UPI00366B44DF
MKLPPSSDESNNPAYKLFWETIANPCNKGFAINRWSMFGHGNRSIYLNSYSIDPLAIGAIVFISQSQSNFQQFFSRAIFTSLQS